MLTFIAKKIFGTRNERVLKSLQPLVEKVNSLEAIYSKMSDTELRDQTAKFKERVANGESLESVQAEAFAVVREASKRTTGLRHFDVQLIGGAVLNMGMISEMKTGEGKTLVASLPAYLNALTGKGVHVVTVNDYLARRDAEWMGRIYNFLGMSVGVVHAGISEKVKREAYKADITYGQNNEFGFDYLRDNMKFSLEDMFQRGHYFAIVDEVDSILIDEARTPLIISGPAEDATDLYLSVDRIVPYLQRDVHYIIDLKSKNPALTEEGVHKVEELLRIENLYDPSNLNTLHHVQQSLKAHTTLERDVDYVVKDGQIIIVDEFTGRLMQGRRWSSGLHQAVEAKEKVKIQRENRTLATVTFQNYFRMYEKLGGMTGTADTEAAEFKEIYNLEAIIIPPNKINIRKDSTDVVYRTRKEKYHAVVNDIEEINKTGQPVLVGTVSIEQSETLAKLLAQKGVPHNVLNAKQHEREAEIVAQAGRFGSVTISTNMAGRGTDILLGGNPEFLAQAETKTKDRKDPAFIDAMNRYIKQCQEEKQRVVEAGGLFILGTERHESRRIDNQLRGRAGRQGDPGCSRFYISLEDDLMVRFGGESMKVWMSKMGWEENEPIEGGIISRTIESAQKRVEAMHFESRKHVTEYDDVMNKQRQVIYNTRAKVLNHEGVRNEIHSMIDDIVEEAVLTVCDETRKPVEWDLEDLHKRYEFYFNAKPARLPEGEIIVQNIFDHYRTQAKDLYDKRAIEKARRLEDLIRLAESEGSPITVDEDIPTYDELEQKTILEAIDHFWNAHLQDMEYLREGIGLRGYGQKNPLYEYQKEGFILFQQLLSNLKVSVVRKLNFEEIVDVNVLLQQIHAEQEKRRAREESMKLQHDSVIDGAEDPSKIEQSRDPNEVKARLEAQKRERRKAKR